MTLALAWLSPAAIAGVRVRAPQDWNEASAADPRAKARAARWAASIGGSLVKVYASSGPDDFVETMAMIERPGAMPIEIVDDSDAAARWLDGELAQITGGAPAIEMSWERTPDLPEGHVHAIYNMADVRLVVAAVPDGANTSFLMMASRTSEELFYGPLFEEAQASLSGGAAPIHPFDVPSHRKWTFIGWLLALAATYGVSLAAFSERRGDHRRVGQIAAMILSGLAALAGIVVYFRLKGHSAALGAVDSTATTLSAEVFGVGVLAAGLAFIAGQMLEGGNDRVQSAPAAADLNVRLKAAEAERATGDE